jgi:ABC-2 type transport system permease protein
MRILNLIIKDLMQVLRDRQSLLFLVAMPVVITVFMGFAYRGGQDDAAQDPHIPLAWVEGTQGSRMSERLYQRLEGSKTVKLIRMEKAAALEAHQKGEVDGILFIPSEIGTPAAHSLSQQIVLLADPASTKGQSLYQILRGPVSQLMSAVEIGQMSADMTGIPAEYTPALELAWDKWDANSSRNLIQVEQAVAPEAESWFGDNPYNQASPGILIQFAVMGLVTSAQILVQERKDRTLQRLMTTAMKPWEILTGHMLAMFVIVFLQTILLVVFGQGLLNVNYMRLPLGTLLISVALGLWVASMGLLIGVIAKSEEQVTMYSMMAMFVFSALGGAWFPLDTAGSAFATIGKALPSAWAMTGLQNILIRGLDLASVWQPVGILLVYALGFLTMAVWRFKAVDA